MYRPTGQLAITKLKGNKLHLDYSMSHFTHFTLMLHLYLPVDEAVAMIFDPRG